MSDPAARSERGPLLGHRGTTLGRSPFASAAPSIAAALAYLVAALVWVVAGGLLPGGRWLAVHLFTLGVLTNLILVFSEHFGRTLTRIPDARNRWQPPVLNAGVLLVLFGLPTGQRWAVAIGATIATAVVTVAYARLRRLRRQAVGARFIWVVRVYERAHGAFVHGAILGALLGTGVLAGGWYGAGRVAHLHVNLLGWGGLTLLATLVFFGPTIARTRIQPGADARAARALRHGATGLTLATFLLLATGFGGATGTIARLLAAVGLAVFAWAATVVCVPVVRAARGANAFATRLPLIGLGTWFIVVVWLDVVVVAAGAWRFLDVLGVVMLVGVLGQAIAAVLTYLAPMLRGRGFTARDLIMARLERGARTRAVAYNLAVVGLVVGAAFGDQLDAAGAWLVRAAWALAIAAIVQALASGAWPLPDAAHDHEAPVASQTAGRYRPRS